MQERTCMYSTCNTKGSVSQVWPLRVVIEDLDNETSGHDCKATFTFIFSRRTSFCKHFTYQIRLFFLEIFKNRLFLMKACYLGINSYYTNI